MKHYGSRRTPDGKLRKSAGKRMVSTLWLAGNLFVGVVTAFCAYGGYIPPAEWIIPSFAVMCFPVMAVVVALLAVIDFFMARRTTAVMILTMIVCAPAFLQFCPLNFGAHSRAEMIPESRKLTLATYNVFDFFNVQDNEGRKTTVPSPSLGWILSERPDIICFQELSSARGTIASGPAREQIDSLWAVYPHRLFTSPGVGVMSKYPVTKIDNRFSCGGSYMADTYEADVDGRKLTIVNVHFQSLGLANDDKQTYFEVAKGRLSESELRKLKNSALAKLAVAFRKRTRQAEEVAAFADSIAGDVIVCGDFNDVPGCHAAITLIEKAHLDDAYSRSALGPTWTFNQERMYFRIDHILYRGDLQAVWTTTDRNRGSDHYPMMTVFELTDPASETDK